MYDEFVNPTKPFALYLKKFKNNVILKLVIMVKGYSKKLILDEIIDFYLNLHISSFSL